jgi:hypothetical protein
MLWCVKGLRTICQGTLYKGTACTEGLDGIIKMTAVKTQPEGTKSGKA